jgi:hypothetical protein
MTTSLRYVCISAFIALRHFIMCKKQQLCLFSGFLVYQACGKKTPVQPASAGSNAGARRPSTPRAECWQPIVLAAMRDAAAICTMRVQQLGSQGLKLKTGNGRQPSSTASCLLLTSSMAPEDSHP